MSIVYDLSNAYKALAGVLAGLDGLSDGTPALVEESVLGLTELDVDNLPYCVIETVGEMSVEQGGQNAALVYEMIVPVKCWYIRPIPGGVVTSDTLRADGDVIATACKGSRLPYEGANTISKVQITGVDWSVVNDVNAIARENQWAVMGVSVSMNLISLERE